MTLIVVNAPPGRETAILSEVHKKIKTLPLQDTVIIAGDFNQAPSAYKGWQDLLADGLLVDITPKNLPTFWTGGSKPASTLDRVLIRHTGIETSTHKARLRASKLRQNRQEHAKLFMKITPIAIVRTSLPTAPVIPAKAFTRAYAPSAALTRTLGGIPEDTTQSMLDRIRAEAWLWWRQQPKSMFNLG